MRGKLRNYLFSILTALALFNAAILAGVQHLDLVDESKAVQLVPQHNLLILLSRTHLGTSHIIRLKNWMELETHLSENALELIPINDAFVQPNLEARITNTNIVWGSSREPNIMATPDYLSANKLLPYVRFGTIAGSPLGHSILVRKKVRTLASQ